MNKRKNFLDTFFSIFDRYPRENFVLGFFGVCAFIILYTVFSYTVIQGSFYREYADKQQLGEVIIPVNRGTIYSATNEGTIVATSVHLYDVAIDPSIEIDKGKLSIFLRDIVYKQTCYLKSQKECYNNMLKYLRLLEIPDFKNEEEYIKDLLLKEIIDKISRTRVTNDLVASDVDVETIDNVSKLNMKGVYANDGKVIVNPEEIVDEQYVIKNLSFLLSLDEQMVAEKLKKRALRYVPIINKVSISVSDEIENFIFEEKDAMKKGLLSEDEAIHRAIILSSNPSRYYPEGSIGSQNIGFVDNDGVGHYGVEGFFNKELKGQIGKMIARKDILGRTITPISLDVEDLQGAGVDIYTTIDRNVQKEVEEILESSVKENGAIKGSVVVMNPFTGEIIAMANYPTFDPNHSGDVYEIEKVTYEKFPKESDLYGYTVLVEDSELGEELIYDGKKIFLRIAEREELGNPALVKYIYKNGFGAGVFKNDAISSLYEPGSIMKAVTVAIGVDTGEIKPYDMYNDTGEVEIDNFRIKNVSSECLGYKSFANALNFSCNVGMIRISQRIGKALFYEYLEEFGFGKVTGVTLDGETTGVLIPYEKWSNAQLFTTSYGLGISVTPLQMASAYSVLANGGYYIQPKIIKKIVFPNGKEINYKTEFSHRVVKESTSKTVTSMLVDGVENGAAKAGRVEGYSLAGKTGTAQIAFRGKYEDGEGSTVTSFAGYGPVEEPKFVIIAKLERPKKSIYGATTSSFVFKQTAEYLIDYYGIPKKSASK